MTLQEIAEQDADYQGCKWRDIMDMVLRLGTLPTASSDNNLERTVYLVSTVNYLRWINSNCQFRLSVAWCVRMGSWLKLASTIMKCRMRKDS